MNMSVNSVYNELLSSILSKLSVPIQFGITRPRQSNAVVSVLDKTSVSINSSVPLNNFDALLQTYIESSQQDSDIDDRINNAIIEASTKYSIDPTLIKAIIKQESNFNPLSISKSGAMGLMQLMPKTAEYLGVSDPYDIEQNIFGGVSYLREMLDKFDDDISLALAAYNAGPGAVQKYNGIPPYEETQHYVPTVLNYKQKYVADQYQKNSADFIDSKIEN